MHGSTTSEKNEDGGQHTHVYFPAVAPPLASAGSTIPPHTSQPTAVAVDPAATDSDHQARRLPTGSFWVPTLINSGRNVVAAVVDFAIFRMLLLVLKVNADAVVVR